MKNDCEISGSQPQSNSLLSQILYWLVFGVLMIGATFVGAQFGPWGAVAGIWIFAVLLWSLFPLVMLLELILLLLSDPSDLSENLSDLLAERLILRIYRWRLYRRLKKAKDAKRRLNAFLSLMVLEDFRPTPYRSREAFIMALNDPSHSLQKAAMENMHRLSTEQALALIHYRIVNEPAPITRNELQRFAISLNQTMQHDGRTSQRTPLNEYGELVRE